MNVDIGLPIGDKAMVQAVTDDKNCATQESVTSMP